MMRGRERANGGLTARREGCPAPPGGEARKAPPLRELPVPAASRRQPDSLPRADRRPPENAAPAISTPAPPLSGTRQPRLPAGTRTTMAGGPYRTHIMRHSRRFNFTQHHPTHRIHDTRPPSAGGATRAEVALPPARLSHRTAGSGVMPGPTRHPALPLAGRTALVTGGTRGIGRAVAKALLRAGAGVFLTGTAREAAERAANELNAEPASAARALGTACDVRSDESVAGLVRFLREHGGRLDILVNNAGIGIYRPTKEITLDEFRQVIETNLTGVFRVTKACLPLLLEAGGNRDREAPSGATVVNIGSLAGRHPFRGGVAYNASKFGLVGLTEAMMLDLRDSGIRVSTVMPGSVATGFAGRSPADGEDWKLSPDDVAEAVLTVVLQRAQALASRIELRPGRPPSKRP